MIHAYAERSEGEGLYSAELCYPDPDMATDPWLHTVDVFRHGLRLRYIPHRYLDMPREAGPEPDSGDAL